MVLIFQLSIVPIGLCDLLQHLQGILRSRRLSDAELGQQILASAPRHMQNACVLPNGWFPPKAPLPLYVALVCEI